MKPRNADINKKILADTMIFRAARRSDVVMQVRNKMCEKGLKNVDLSERLGVSEANISRWLRGNQNLSLDTIYQLADALDEPLRIELGTAEVSAFLGLQERSSDAIHRHEVVLDTSEAATAFLAERSNAPRDNVVSMVAFAKLRSRAEASHGHPFALARSEFDIAEPEERMVN